MTREMILWASFFHHMEKQAPYPGWLENAIETHAQLIARADQLSGWEQEETGTQSKETRLVSIFSNVNKDPTATPDRDKNETQRFFIPLTPLSNDKSVFPVKEGEKEVENVDDHMKKFERELNAYMEHKENPGFDTFYYLAQKYLWCIPTPHFRNEPHVSLFEHLKATAAIASILYDSGGKEEFALVGFDISGIQDFIYTVTSKGAAKSLKGRSFYLQLLEMAISRYILEKLGLSITNVVYTGGGKGILLAPPSKMKDLADIGKHINAFLFERMDTKVYVGTAYETFKSDGFKQFNIILGRLMEKLQKKKRQKFASLLKDEKTLKYLFTPSIEAPETCSICGKEGKPVKVDKEGNRWCAQCLLFKDMGTWLRDARAILETVGNEEKRECTVTFTFGEQEYDYTFLNENEAKNPPHGKMLYCLNDTELFSTLIRKETPTGYLFVAGNQVPLKKNSKEVMEFTDIAESSDGTHKLGVVRGDVDNLGSIFTNGLGKKTTLGRISQLSFLLKHFFSSTANLIFPDQNHEFIVYSGGDDFFVIGPWNRLIDDLAAFREDFKTYTCENPAFSFSASFSIFNSRYPAFKFAEVAGDGEKKAKDNKADGREKDSISFLGKVVFWDDFYRLKELEEELVKMVRATDISRSYIQLLQRIAQYNSLGRMKPKNDIELRQSARFHKWKWYYAWQAARLAERLKQGNKKKYQNDLEPPLREIDNFLFSSTYKTHRFINPDSLYLIEIPARWAELKTKKQGGKNA